MRAGLARLGTRYFLADYAPILGVLTSLVVLVPTSWGRDAPCFCPAMGGPGDLPPFLDRSEREFSGASCLSPPLRAACRKLQAKISYFARPRLSDPRQERLPGPGTGGQIHQKRLAARVCSMGRLPIVQGRSKAPASKVGATRRKSLRDYN